MIWLLSILTNRPEVFVNHYFESIKLNGIHFLALWSVLLPVLQHYNWSLYRRSAPWSKDRFHERLDASVLENILLKTAVLVSQKYLHTQRIVNKIEYACRITVLVTSSFVLLMQNYTSPELSCCLSSPYSPMVWIWFKQWWI